MLDTSLKASIMDSVEGHRMIEEVRKMFETVKVVNGYEITRLVGSRGFYHVNIWEDGAWGEYHTFRTIKAAAQFCETLPAKH